MSSKEQNNLLREARIKRLVSIDAADAFRRLVAIEEKYNELIMAVESKFPGESRHETALRYIKDREIGVVYTPGEVKLTNPKPIKLRPQPGCRYDESH